MKMGTKVDVAKSQSRNMTVVVFSYPNEKRRVFMYVQT